MTVFKTFWKVVKKYKGTIILYTVMLIIFGGVNMSTDKTSSQFTNSKPNVMIINHDHGSKITKNLIQYIKNHSKIVQVKKQKSAIKDALFYRDINYIIIIPKNYGKDVMNGIQPTIDIESTGNFESSLAEMILTKYIKIQNIYQKKANNEEELIHFINQNLSKTTNIEITSKLDMTKTSNASFYFNFASYSIMAIIIFIVCLVLSSFHDESLIKRTSVSGISTRKYNRDLLFASLVFSTIVWILFIILGTFILKDVMFSLRGIIYMINSFIFTFTSLTIALLISSLVKNKNAISGIVNVVALGSAFLCGAFVPAEWLPSFVLNIAHVLPSYWYIRSNDLLKTIEVLNPKSLQPIFINFSILFGFSLLFIIINHLISKYHKKL